MHKPIIGISGSRIINNGGALPGYYRSYVNEDTLTQSSKTAGFPTLFPLMITKT